MPRTLFVKQHFDVFGPSRPTEFRRDGALGTLAAFPYKATYWEMTCLLSADWIIVKSAETSLYRKYVEYFPHLRKFISDQQRHAINAKDAEVTNYDLIITLEPFFQSCVAGASVPLFFFMNEHSNREFVQQLEAPSQGYTAFLDHMCGSTLPEIPRGARVLSTPYLRSPAAVRRLFPKTAQPTGQVCIWLEARTIIFNATGEREGLWNAGCDDYLSGLRQKYAVEIRTRGNLYNDFYNVRDGASIDAKNYLDDMRGAVFFIANNAVGAGQTLADAASLGLLCFGSSTLVYHRMICAPEYLDLPLESAIHIAKKLAAQPRVLKRLLAAQDRRLADTMMVKPLDNILFAALHSTDTRQRKAAAPISQQYSIVVVDTGFLEQAALRAAATRVGYMLDVMTVDSQLATKNIDIVIKTDLSGRPRDQAATFLVIHQLEKHIDDYAKVMELLEGCDGILTISSDVSQFFHNLSNWGHERPLIIGCFGFTPTRQYLAAEIEFLAKAKAFQIVYAEPSEVSPLGLTLCDRLRAQRSFKVVQIDAFYGMRATPDPHGISEAQLLYCRFGAGLVMPDGDNSREDATLLYRVCEVVSVGAVAICPDVGWLHEIFGDSIYYYPLDDPPLAIEILGKVIGELNYFPDRARVKAHQARSLFDRTLAAEVMLENLAYVILRWRDAERRHETPGRLVDS
jgi:hypothetical protein